MDKIKIIIVDDREIFRNALRFFINQIKDFEIIAEAANGREFLDIMSRYKADIILMDIVMPVMDGIEATKIAININSELKIIALTSFGEIEYLNIMYNSGACGFLKKDNINEELEKTIRHTVSASRSLADN